MSNTLSPHAALMTMLTSKHDNVAQIIAGKRFHYVDIPLYGNIGDLLIMHGTLQFFRQQALSPSTTTSLAALNTSWIDHDDVIVCQGGGNFGDLYPWHHQFREMLIRKKAHNRIIILPQSIHFSTAQARRQSAAIFRAHHDVHLCVRDQYSFDIAQEFTDHVYLAPDMAHHLYPIVNDPRAAVHDTLLHSRVDQERSDLGDLSEFNIATTIDWPQLVGQRQRVIDRLTAMGRRMKKMHATRLSNALIGPYWRNYSAVLIRDAVRLFAQHRQIVTNRLHGHILACLMDKPNIVLDNNYGKNSRYIQAWTHSSPLLTLRPSATPVERMQ